MSIIAQYGLAGFQLEPHHGVAQSAKGLKMAVTITTAIALMGQVQGHFLNLLNNGKRNRYFQELVKDFIAVSFIIITFLF